MKVDVAIVGGGLAGSALGTVLARKGMKVLILERETKFKDRVRGENMMPWGVARARRLGVLDDLIAAGGRLVPFFDIYAMGTRTEHRPLPQTTPDGEACLNMYHPDMQEAMLAGAIRAGCDVRRGAVSQGLSADNGGWTVSYAHDSRPQSVTARLLVGADGRFSAMREWGGFAIARDPERFRIAGALVDGLGAPEDATHFLIGPGVGSFVAPLGGGRARMYFIYLGATGDRKLSGREKTAEFVEGCRTAGVPADWLDGANVVGPLAEFEGADRSVPSPARAALALIGDAAAATDPSWGSGLSKTMVDVENLATKLIAADDWDAALHAYAREHDDYYRKLHDIMTWMTELFWTGGPAADERRARVIPRMRADPTGFPDLSGQGPFGPCDEEARRLILGES